MSEQPPMKKLRFLEKAKKAPKQPGLNPTAEVQYANSLKNLTGSAIRIYMTVADGERKKDEWFDLPAQSIPLSVKYGRSGIRFYLPCLVDDEEKEASKNEDVEDKEEEGKPIKRKKSGSIKAVSPRAFDGFMDPIPEIKRKKWTGVIVDQCVGPYLETSSSEWIRKVFNAEFDDREVPVYGVDTHPESLVLDANGCVRGYKRLIRYNADI